MRCFFAGALGQRIFQEPFSWKALGIEIRGRSQTLKVLLVHIFCVQACIALFDVELRVISWQVMPSYMALCGKMFPLARMSKPSQIMKTAPGILPG
jgi:hypothetical protein